ncbi:LysR family transcriptional regulator [Herbaspirillum frisingense]|uniref:LysR family transcriptional regulator n=1 Tax=Herbaspirillum frisingense TaxID=92645 RepID=UPI0015FED514|nr:LysR family transcriptional regulator [Herbaspirillum frisingense]QNB06706.1 LysR family transcriptional regulator [Herbaspirillum frisingense]
MSDRLSALRLFVRVARQGSFSAAGRDFNIPQPSVSRTIARLEKEMGATLFLRSTRAVTLTNAGASFLARIEPLLDGLSDAEYALRGTGELRGMVRVSLGSSFALREVIPRLSAFLLQHPALNVDLVMEDERQDLVADGVDVAFRFGTLTDSSAVTRPILTWPKVLVASSTYLARAGAPERPQDLSQHAIILGPGSTSVHWSLTKEGATQAVPVTGRVIVRGYEGVVAAAASGLGIALTSVGACHRELSQGELVQILPDWDVGMVELNAVFANGRSATPAARALVEYLFDPLRSKQLEELLTIYAVKSRANKDAFAAFHALPSE